MITLDIQPLKGVGPIRFGMTLSEVTALLGPSDPTSIHRKLFLKIVFVDFDEEGRVEFIEMSRGTGVRCVLNGTDLHRETAFEALEVVSKLGTFDPSDPELGYSYVFPSLELSLWRPAKDEQYFSAVGVGRKNYFSMAGV